MNLPDYLNKSEIDKQNLFYSSIKRIVFENFNYCNRTCSFCINSIIDRRSNKIALSNFTFDKLISELSTNDFSNTIAIGRYSEPLAMSVTFERIKVIRQFLENAHILINTNGDYLNKQMLNKLNDCGLDELKIMVYLPTTEPFNKTIALKYSITKISELGLDYILSNVSESFLYFKILHKGNMHISVRCEDYSNPKHGCDRGGSLQNFSDSRRDTPCFSPYFEVNIDYNGNVLPCCNIISDFTPHKKYILGNINQNSLYQIYFNDKSEWFRNTLKEPGLFQEPCRYCSYNFPKQEK